MNNTDKKTQGKQTASTTNYQSGIFMGTQFADQAEAVEAGAKQYARRDWTNTKVLAVEMGYKGTEIELATALLNAKRSIILKSIEKREEIPSLFE